MSARRSRFQALTLVLGLLVAPLAAVPAHDAASCCPPEHAAAPCHGDVEDCLSRAAMTCCAPAPAFPARPGALFEHPVFSSPLSAFEPAPLPEPEVTAFFRRAAELSARASPLLHSVVLRI